MHVPRCSSLLAATLVLACVSAGRAQTDPFRDLDVDQAALAQRLQFSKGLSEEWKLLDTLRLSGALPNLEGREMQRLIRRLHSQNPDLMRQLVERFDPSKLPETKRRELSNAVEKALTNLKKEPDPRRSNDLNDDLPQNPRGEEPPPEQKPSSSEPGPGETSDEDWTTALMKRFADTFDDLDLGEEGGRLRELLDSLMNGRALPDGFDLQGPFGRLAESMPDLRGLVPDNLPNLPDLRSMWNGISLPSMPSVSLPSLGGGLPSGPGFSGPAGGFGGVGLLWVVALVIMAGVLWKVLGQPGWSEDGGAPPWRLGPWPVTPTQVQTRGDLIRAFEYLVLLVLGRDARTRHHLALAAQLAARPNADPVRQQTAAERLAHLYEQARYAPADEPLNEHELDDARRDLCFLAGVTPS